MCAKSRAFGKVRWIRSKGTKERGREKREKKAVLLLRRVGDHSEKKWRRPRNVMQMPHEEKLDEATLIALW